MSEIYDIVANEHFALPSHWDVETQGAGILAGDAVRSDGYVALVTTGPNGRWCPVRPGTMSPRKLPGRRKPSYFASLARAIDAVDLAWPHPREVR